MSEFIPFVVDPPGANILNAFKTLPNPEFINLQFFSELGARSWIRVPAFLRSWRFRHSGPRERDFF